MLNTCNFLVKIMPPRLISHSYRSPDQRSHWRHLVPCLNPAIFFCCAVFIFVVSHSLRKCLGMPCQASFRSPSSGFELFFKRFFFHVIIPRICPIAFCGMAISEGSSFLFFFIYCDLILCMIFFWFFSVYFFVFCFSYPSGLPGRNL